MPTLNDPTNMMWLLVCTVLVLIMQGGLTDQVPVVWINTLLAGAFGGLSALALSFLVLKRPDMIAMKLKAIW